MENFYALQKDPPNNVVIVDATEISGFSVNDYYIIREFIEEYYLPVSFSDQDNNEIVFTEKSWRLLVQKESRDSYAVADVTDPLGNVRRIFATERFYKGVVEFHRLLKYLSYSPDWLTAKEKEKRMEHKKVMIALKNGKSISVYHGELKIELAYREGVYIMFVYKEDIDNEIDPYEFISESKVEGFNEFMEMVESTFPDLAIPYSR